MTSQGKILITDDEPDLRRALNRTLHALGFEITEAANGEQALERMEERPRSTPFSWTSTCPVSAVSRPAGNSAVWLPDYRF